VIVRSAGPDDVEALARLRAAWREAQPTPEFLATFREWFAREQSSRSWWLAEVDGEAIGMVNVKTFDRMPSPDRPASQWGYLANLYVDPAHRGSGAGGQLISAVVQHARRNNFVRLLLAPSELAAPLYHRHGFRSADELLMLPLET
jgi:GNAT superfamily N-acetyltransferase